MTPELTTELTSIFTLELFLMIISGIILVVSGLLLKSVAESITSYILFYSDKFVSVGTPVKVYGEIGYIQSFSPFWVCIKTTEGFLRIPIIDWRRSRFMILKSYNLQELKENL